MSNDNQKQVNASMGFGGWLALLFIALKLLNVITWSWLWVLSPIWIPLSIVIVLSVLLAIIK